LNILVPFSLNWVLKYLALDITEKSKQVAIL